MVELKYNVKKRAPWITLVSIIVFFALVLRLTYWQFIKGAELKSSAIQQQTLDSVVSSKRGIIYDRNGKVLAQSISVQTVTATPAEVKASEDVDEIADTLADILGADEDKIKEIITKNSSYEVVARKIDNKTAEKIRKAGLKGIYLVEDSKRTYPYGSLASHVIGFVGTDNQGLDGIEMVYDKYLKGVPGRMISSKSASGTEMPFEYEKYINPENGANLVLTIDEVIQHFVEEELKQAVADYDVRNGASCIIMNAKTGEILAMATYPDYDLNAPFTLPEEIEKELKQSFNASVLEAEDDEELKGDEAYNKAYNERLSKLWRNKAVVDSYEPGSTFKPFTAAMALEENLVSLNEFFSCSGGLQVEDYYIRCWKDGGHGQLTFAGGFENSCNPVFMNLGARVGPVKFMEYYKKFGFTDTTGFDLPGEAAGTFHELSRFKDVELATSAFGQTFIITPLQLITAYTAITNGGVMVRPRIAKELTDDNGNVIKKFETEIIRQAISTETANTIRDILEGVVENGTSKNAYIRGYRLAGKTGTSEKFPRGNGKYVASFVGFAPANDPEIIGLVMLDEPMGSSHMGGAIAAPTFKKIFDEVLRYMDIEPQYTEEDMLIQDKTVPNVEGLSVNEIAKAFDGTGLKYNVLGEGDKVVNQVPKGGSTLPEGSTVAIYTESNKADTVVVPDVRGMTASVANQALTNAGLNMKITGASDSGQGGEVVSSQMPEAGAEVQRGSAVSVEFSFADVH
ncbi:MAG: PASTA domain-containing protein [Clostridia bacterium]|nr:PASTA domain-containing protein [Clostridia bacterium]